MPAHSGGMVVLPLTTPPGGKNVRAEADPAASNAAPRARAQRKSFIEGSVRRAGAIRGREQGEEDDSGKSRTPERSPRAAPADKRLLPSEREISGFSAPPDPAQGET